MQSLSARRSRRFRAARDAADARATAQSEGEVFEDSEVFDSNCITPGTEFMETVRRAVVVRTASKNAQAGRYINYFIRMKQKSDPFWRRCKVIFSGHDVAGEGEHKIMEYIRARKLQPDYEPQTRHCIYGLDADLVMLSLATHEPHVALLREQIDFMAYSNVSQPASVT